MVHMGFQYGHHSGDHRYLSFPLEARATAEHLPLARAGVAMRSWRAWLVRCLSVFGGARREDDLAAELDAHLHAHIEDNLRAGMPPIQARRDAQMALGGRQQTREACQDRRGIPVLERLHRDGGYALRTLGRSPAFASVAILTFAVGLGATTTMFSIVNRTLLEPLPYPDPGQLYLGRVTATAFARIASSFPIDERIFHTWRTQCEACADVALVGGLGFTLTGTSEPERIPGLQVSSNFFRTLGVRPSLGRDFLPGEELPGGARVVLLSNALWRSHFGGDPAIVGRPIRIDGEPHEVIGIMPPDVFLPKGEQWGPLFAHDRLPLLFRPLGFDVAAISDLGHFNYSSLVRLRPGVSASQAVAALNAEIVDVATQSGLERFRAVLIPLQDQVTTGVRAPLWLLLGAVGAVWLIACVNVGNLMLVRATSRHREASIRLALGASRSGLFGIVLYEAAVVVVGGAALGMGLAAAAVRLLAWAAPVGLPRIESVRLDWRVLVFTTLAAAASTVVCGVLPAWRFAASSPQHGLKAGTSQTTDTPHKRRLTQVLVGVEVALSALLLVIGGLLIVSFVRVMRVDKGFEVDHVITQGVSLMLPQFREAGAQTRFIDQVLLKLAGLPGVRAVGVTNQVPLHGETWIDALSGDGRPAEDLRQTANFRFVSPGYWPAMGIRLTHGRLIEPGDRDRPVAVLSEKAAGFLWPQTNPLGRHIHGAGPSKPSLEVVGVVADIREAGLTHDPPAMVYEPYWALPMAGPNFVVRTDAPLEAVASGIRTMVHAVDPDVPLTTVQTMDQVLNDSVEVRRFLVYVAATFAVSALMLAALGIYGVVSFMVARRTHELGVRLALGAPHAQLVRMVLGDGMQPVLIGLVAGLGVALSGGRVIASQLYGVAPHDPAILFAVSLLLVLVALVACGVPARRATRIDPLQALRFE
jgi:predicted permease